MSFDQRERASILGALRPAEDQILGRAVFATYSLDLIAMLGLVLALGGEAEAEYSASPLGLVQAFDRVRGRLLVMHQEGKIIAPRAHRSVLPLLDTMLHAVRSDERTASWHPKVALVRYLQPDGPAAWRFWIGSRNLTGSNDLEAGVLLTTTRSKGGRTCPQIAELAKDLLGEARWTDREFDELGSARWLAPDGVRLLDLLWRRPGDKRPFVTGPFRRKADRACAVSPFINGAGLARARAAAGTHVELLTTQTAGSACSPADRIGFRTAAEPSPHVAVVVEDQQEQGRGEFTDPPPSGVHAKLLAVACGATTTLLLGSANLTGRGLDGPNAEACALLEVTHRSLADELFAHVHAGTPLISSEPDPEEVERFRIQQALDAAVSQVLAVEFELIQDQSGMWLTCRPGLDEVLGSLSLEVAPFLDPDRRVDWPARATSVRLTAGTTPLSERTSLVAMTATSPEDLRIVRSWVQSVPIAGLDEIARDRALLARYVGASRFRDWLRSTLDGIDGGRGERWSDQPGGPGRTPGAALAQLFTLETMLASWAKDPSSFEAKLGSMQAMLDAFQEAFEALPDGAEKAAALADLAEVRPFLAALCSAVLQDAA